MLRLLASALVLAAGVPLSRTGPEPARICLAPTAIETGSVGDAANAVRETFTSFLSGPKFTITPLQSRLESQARDEAKAGNCPYLLLTRVKHTHKQSGGGLLGRAAAGAAQQGAWSAGSAIGSVGGRVAAGAAAGAAGAAASSYASTVKSKDELTLSYRLESAAGAALLDKSEKHKAESDGEDLLTPMVQKAAEAIVSAVSTTQH
jgi:hypothetical protein